MTIYFYSGSASSTVQRSVKSVAVLICILCFTSNATADPGGVRLNQPRINPDPQGYVENQRQAGREVDPEKVLNVYATLANHPKLSDAWLPFARYILQDNSLPPRDRELVILRIGWLCNAAYEWSHHSLTGLRLGMTDKELSQIIRGANDPAWSDFDRALIRATDELHADAFISEETWATLSAKYTEQQMMDLVFTIGEYNMVSMALNSFGVQLDKDRQGFPSLENSAR